MQQGSLSWENGPNFSYINPQIVAAASGQQKVLY